MEKAGGAGFDGKISDLTDDLPDFVQKEKRQSDKERTGDVVDTEDNLEVVGGEKIGADDSTLVRKQKFKRGGDIRASLVGMKEGVPGFYSGYERTTRKYSKLSNKDSDSASEDSPMPVRPPRKARSKSDSLGNGDSYDRLWTPRDKSMDESSEHVYSLLGSPQAPLYDDVEKGNDDVTGIREIVLNSSPVKDIDWVEDGRRFGSAQGNRKSRPMSAVVLPISPVGDNGESDIEEDDEWGSDFGSVSTVYDEVESDDELYEVVGDLSKKVNSNRNSVYEALTAVRAKTAQALRTPPSFAKKHFPPAPSKPLPPVPDESGSFNVSDEEAVPYVDIIFDGDDVPKPSLPPLDEFASEDDIKRYQIIKYILENEKMYLSTVNNLIQDYEKPLLLNKVITPDSIKVIFMHLQEIGQCHQLFNIALAGRMAEWSQNPTIGDIIYASFSKSMVLKAYTSYVDNFTCAMDRVKETCKMVPAFLSFLRARLKRSLYKYTFYDLLKRPLGRFPQLVVLLQELLKVTPVSHPDRLPLQMALTHLECLSELICDKRRDMEMKYKVSQLDKYFIGLNKKVADGRVVRTKHQRLFLLSDLLICASIINKSNAANLIGKKRYRLKWCVPVAEVDILDVGSGILVNMDSKNTTTIKYTHPVSSPRPGAINVEEHLEDLQHDLTIIGQIAGLVASLRKRYEIINEPKVSEWYRDVKETFDQELDLANMHWLELSIPAKDKKTTTCLFNLHPPQRKIEWTTELENAKLRLAFENNPGWYILEDESANIGNMGILRRNLPLLANKVPLFMVESKYSIEKILEITPNGSTKPVLWIFSGTDHAGQITLMEMCMSSVPHVIESFNACEARILAAEAVKDKPGRFADPTSQKTLVWCGTMSGRIQVFNASSEDHEEVATTKLRDAILCFKHFDNKMFCGVANGTIACFRRKADSSWDIDNPVIVCLSNFAVMDIAEARGQLWCASGNCIHVLDSETLGVEHKIYVGENSKVPVKHLVSYGSGVWASQRKSPTLHLYHNENYECIQSLSVTTPLQRMRNDIDCQIQNLNIDKAYITTLMARGGLLWVGTDIGVVVTYPLPRLGGVPQVSGRPCVSFHGHENAVRCLHSFRVERAFKPRTAAKGQSDDAIARSLFYFDPFDEAATGLNLPYLEHGTVNRTETPSDAGNEPFYYALEQGNDQTKGTRQKTAYEQWLSSFGDRVKNVDPQFSADTLEMRDRHGSYNSDESMDSDTEFSFIEDKLKAVPPRMKKNGPGFSVEIRQPNGANKAPQGTVKLVNAPGAMPSIAETNFAEMLGNFAGFDLQEETSEKTAGKSPDTSLTGSGFVMVEKTNSGYEEPIPAADKVVTAPYATVKKKENAKDSPAEAQGGEIDNSIQVVGIGVKEPPEDVVEQYKNEPLPDLPAKTLYERSKEWGESLGNEYENLKATVPDVSINDDKERNDDKGCADEENNGTEQKEQGIEEQNENVFESGKDQSGEAVESAPMAIRTADIPLPDLPDEEEPELDFERQEEEEIRAVARDVKSPIFIKITDIKTNMSIEGGVNVDVGSVRSRGTTFSQRETEEHKRPTKSRSQSDVFPEAASEDKKEPWMSQTARRNKMPFLQGDFSTPSSKTLPAATKSTASQQPQNLNLSNVNEKVEPESVYTPLLGQNRESNPSSLSGIGATSFEAEMELSASLARDKITRQSQQGNYASLISVSGNDNESRREFLMKPMYVVSVGGGYVDLRRKQKIGSGLEFFMKLAASEPEPKLLIWKVIS